MGLKQTKKATKKTNIQKPKRSRRQRMMDSQSRIKNTEKGRDGKNKIIPVMGFG